MSDLGTLLGRLRDQRAPAPFASPDTVRRRARQRAHRRRALVLGAVAVVAAGSLGTGAWVRDRDRDPAPAVVAPSAPPPSSAAPRPTAIAPGMLLQAADFAAGDLRPAKAELFEGPPWWWASLCPDTVLPALAHRRDMQTVTFGVGGQPPVYSEILEHYADGWGTRSLVDISTVLTTCDAASGYRIADTGIAGDESYLVRDDSGKPAVRYIAVVRVGEFVATVILPPGPDAAAALALARRAADRLD